jgi:hypothetical protein
MSCNISQNIGLDCLDGAGSVVRAFILNGPADSYTEAAGDVTAITVGGAAVGPSDWYTWSVPRQTSGYTETANVSVENGTLNFQKDLTLVFNRMDATKRNELLLAAQNQDMIVAFEDANGEYWVFGLDKGAFTSAHTATTATTYADRNGYEITLSSVELTPAFTIDSTLLVA